MPGYVLLNAAIALVHALSERAKAAARALKYAAWAGWIAVRSVAIASATADMVPGRYHRCGFGVLSGSPSRSWTTMSLRELLGTAPSIVFMNVS